MYTVIDSFRDEFEFLSNFFPSEIVSPTLEHHYQAAKTTDPNWRRRILTCPTPGQAKRLGRQAPLRPDWEKRKVIEMLGLLRLKFKSGTPLAAKLLATGDAILVEGNDWNDTFWGVSGGKGQNVLGLLLMLVRLELRVKPFLP